MKTKMDGMDEGLYNDEPSSDAEPMEAKGSVDQQEQEHGTDLMAKSSFPGDCKVGDKYEIEITGDHGDQFSVKVIKDEHPQGRESMSGDQDDMERLNKSY